MLAGSIDAWGMGLEADLTLAVWVQVQAEFRLARLRARGQDRYAQRVAPGVEL